MENQVERFINFMKCEGCSEKVILEQVRRLVSIAFEECGSNSDFQKPVQSVYTDEETKIISLLRKLGIPSSIKGYFFLMEAIHQWRQNPGQSVTKELYPKIAKKYEDTTSKVERALGYAIQRVYEHCDKSTLLEVFGNSSVKPTTKEAISRLAEYLDLNNL